MGGRGRRGPGRRRRGLARWPPVGQSSCGRRVARRAAAASESPGVGAPGGPASGRTGAVPGRAGGTRRGACRGSATGASPASPRRGGTAARTHRTDPRAAMALGSRRARAHRPARRRRSPAAVAVARGQSMLIPPYPRPPSRRQGSGRGRCRRAPARRRRRARLPRGCVGLLDERRGVPGLDEVPVGAGPLAARLVVRVAGGGEDVDRHPPQRGVGAHRRAEVVAGSPRHRPVGDDQVGPGLTRQGQTLVGRARAPSRDVLRRRTSWRRPSGSSRCRRRSGYVSPCSSGNIITRNEVVNAGASTSR